MKNTFKVLGIVAIVATIGFSFASCLSFGGGGEGDDVNWIRGMDGVVIPAEWPSLDVWERYGVAGGLQQPSGTNVVVIYSETYDGIAEFFSVGLENASRSTFDNLVSQIERKGGWTVYKRESSRREEAISFVQGTYNIAFALDTRDNTLTIMMLAEKE